MPHFDDQGRDTWLCQTCARVFTVDTVPVWRQSGTGRGNACSTCVEKYVTRVFDRLPDYVDGKRANVASVRRGIAQCFEWGFTEDHALAFTRCTEEVNPLLSEETALARMKVITDQYPYRRKGR